MARFVILGTMVALLLSCLIGLSPSASAAEPDDGRGTDFVVNTSDNICGLDSPRQLSRPAKVDYDKVLGATPEIKKLKKEKIDRNSPEGIKLRTEAADRVKKACEKVRVAKNKCSVWKKIRRRDGKAIPDLTEEVKKEISSTK